MRVAVTIEDPDTDLDELRIEGSVTGCSVRGRDFGPVIQGSTSEMLCHHVTDHTGFVAVTDPSGNGDSLAFRFGPCDTGVVAR